MEPASNLVRVSLPNYLASLPIPNSIGGWFKLSFQDYARLVPFFTVVGGVGYISYVSYKQLMNKTPPVNPSIKKDSPKVVDSFAADELGGKTCFCRCWRSKSFPYCDGSHNTYNKECGDNTGPLIITPKKE